MVRRRRDRRAILVDFQPASFTDDPAVMKETKKDSIMPRRKMGRQDLGAVQEAVGSVEGVLGVEGADRRPDHDFFSGGDRSADRLHVRRLVRVVLDKRQMKVFVS